MSAAANGLIPDAVLPLHADDSKAISSRVRLLNLTGVILPLLGFVAIIVSLGGPGLRLGR